MGSGTAYITPASDRGSTFFFAERFSRGCNQILGEELSCVAETKNFAAKKNGVAGSGGLPKNEEK